MKKYIYSLLMLLAIVSCKDEENTFQPAVGADAFTFESIPGGAVMHYTFPKDEELMGLNIRYKDYAGHDILRSGSALSDSILLEGFNQAQQDVAAEVRFVKRNGEESDPIPVSFSTKDSAPYAFFNGVKVQSGWNGFSVLTDNTTNAKGLAHVYYLGTDPLSGQPDTILIRSFNITEGKDTMNFSLQQKSDLNTIIIRTEDYRGYMVREEKWENVASYNTAKLDPSKFDFYCDKSIEDEECLIGKKYLFDGELRGETYFKNNEKDHYGAYDMYNFFLAGPDAFDEPMYIDMHENKLTAEVRMYAPLNVRQYGWAYKGPYCTLFRNDYFEDKIPCEVEVYAAKDDHGTAGNWSAKDWVKVSKYKQDPDTGNDSRWNAKCLGYRNVINSYNDALKTDSVFLPLKLLCDQGEGYRYLKIVVHNTYNKVGSDTWQFGPTLNTAKYFTMQELEVWTKKEN